MLEKIALCRGKDGFGYFTKDGTTEFNLQGILSDSVWKVNFEFTSFERIPFKEKVKAFLEMVTVFMKDAIGAKNISIMIKGSPGSMIKQFTDKYCYKVVSVRKFSGTPEEPVEKNLFILSKRK